MHNLYIVWNDSSNTGIPIIDEQHRGIISTINSLHYSIRTGEGDKVIKPTLITLEQYIIIHFRTEESLMEHAQYPGFDTHLELHRDLARKTDAIYRNAQIDGDPDIVLKFMKDWWLHHINIEDKKYVPHVIGLGTPASS